jgi:hypothetical protein
VTEKKSYITLIPVINVEKLFFFVTKEETKQSSLFVLGKLIQTCLITSKGGAYPSILDQPEKSLPVANILAYLASPSVMKKNIYFLSPGVNVIKHFSFVTDDKAK